jgi:hypothetical protein
MCAKENPRNRHGPTLLSRHALAEADLTALMSQVNHSEMFRLRAWSTPGDFGPVNIPLDAALNFIAAEGLARSRH